MTELEWAEQAQRLSAAWPATPMDANRSDLYYDLLKDLDPAHIEQAITRLIAGQTDALPTPTKIREQATEALIATPSGIAPATPPVARTSVEEREARRPWLGILFGLFGLFPLALWLGIKSHRERRAAINQGRQPAGDSWPPIAAIILGVIPLAALIIGGTLALSGVILNDDGPNSGDYLTRAELQKSIIEQGEFFLGVNQPVRATDAQCVEDSPTGTKYRCIIEFRGGTNSTYVVTVASDGTWVAEPTS